MSYVETFYPESRFGGFTDIDGSIAFYARINALITLDWTVLDVGCGRGVAWEDPVAFRRSLHVLKGKCAKTIGIDVDEAARDNPGIDDFRLLKIGYSWPIESSSIHMVICDWVLEHVPEPEEFFDELARVLRPGGYLCIRTPNAWSYVGLVSRLVPNRYHGPVLKKSQENRKTQDVFPTYYRCNSIQRLRRIMRNHRFSGVVYGYEAEPFYLNFSKVFYALGVLHQKLAPGWARPAIFAFGRKTEQT
jgi:SAM-dependent methyltransferase